MNVVELEQENRRFERSSHAIYGLVIITATLVADRQYAESAMVSLLVLWGSALVLVLAHTYSALLAQLGRRGHRLTYVERHVLIADNIPLGSAVIVPTMLLVASGLGVLSLTAAMDASILFSLASLCGLGAYQARQQGASVTHQIGIGALGGVVGLLVIVAEVVLAH